MIMYDRLGGSAKARGPYAKADDADLLPRIRQITAQRPTYGSRRIAAVLNRQQRAEELASLNHKRSPHHGSGSPAAGAALYRAGRLWP